MIFSMQYKLQNKVCVRTEADKVNLQVDVSASSKDKHKITSIKQTRCLAIAGPVFIYHWVIRLCLWEGKLHTTAKTGYHPRQGVMFLVLFVSLSAVSI